MLNLRPSLAAHLSGAATGGGGGGNTYVASAVHLDGANSTVTIPSLSATDGPGVHYSFCFKVSSQQATNKTIFVVDAVGNYSSELYFKNETPGLGIPTPPGGLASLLINYHSPLPNGSSDPAITTAALGQPMILFSGNADTFAVNQGSGGAATPTNITNATTSPSD